MRIKKRVSKLGKITYNLFRSYVYPKL